MPKIKFLPHIEICPEGAEMKHMPVSQYVRLLCEMGCILNMRVKCHVHARRAMFMLEMGMNRSMKLKILKKTIWIKHGVLIQTHD